MPQSGVPSGTDEATSTAILVAPATIVGSANCGSDCQEALKQACDGPERFRSTEDVTSSTSSPGQGRQVPEAYLVAIRSVARMSLPTAQTIPDAGLREFVVSIIQMAIGIEKMAG